VGVTILSISHIMMPLCNLDRASANDADYIRSVLTATIIILLLIIIFVLLVKTNRSTLHTIYSISATQGSNDTTQTVTQDSNNNQV